MERHLWEMDWVAASVGDESSGAASVGDGLSGERVWSKRNIRSNLKDFHVEEARKFRIIIFALSLILLSENRGRILLNL